MKKAAGIIITLLLFTQLSRAQLSWNWAQSGNVPPGGRITSNDIAMDDAGNVYTCGAYIPQINNYSDIYIAKYNATGNLLWFKTFGSQKSDEAYSITLDTNKNIYITGYYGAQFITPVVNDSIYFDHLFLPSIGGTADIFLAKFDMNGNAIWAKNMGNPTTHDWGLNLTTDQKGHLVVTGMFGDGVSDTSTSRFDTISLLSHKNSDVFIAKYDTSGNIIWAKSAGGVFSDIGFSIAIDSVGNVYAAGHFGDPWALFDTVKLNSISSGFHFGDIFLAKYNSMGQLLWVNPIGIVANGGGPTAPAANLGIGKLMLTPDGKNIYVPGYYAHGSIKFHNGYTLSNFGNARDLFIARYNDKGQLIWAKKAGGTGDDVANAVAVDNSDGIYVTGYYRGKIGFGSDTLQYMGGYDIFITRYDTSGNVTWATSVAGTGGEAASSINVNSSGTTLCIGGRVNTPLNFGTHTVNADASNNYFVAKASLTTGINPFNVPEKDILVYPNPTTGILQVSDPSGKHLSVQLFDVLGRQVYQQAGKQKTVLNISHLPDGVYFLQCTGSRLPVNRKIILQH